MKKNIAPFLLTPVAYVTGSAIAAVRSIEHGTFDYHATTILCVVIANTVFHLVSNKKKREVA